LTRTQLKLSMNGCRALEKRHVDLGPARARYRSQMKAIHQFKQEERFMNFRISMLFLTVVAVAGSQSASAQANHKVNGYDLVDKSGNMRKPADYRDVYQLLGTYTVLDPKGDQMHVTYATPGTAEYYRKTGKFPDGAVLIKEIFGTDHAQLTTGDSHWASGTKVWFVKIKDDKNRFPQNPLWGDGWGWFLFKADAPDKQVATDYKKDCLACHVPAKSTDWTYVQGFPVLKSK